MNKVKITILSTELKPDLIEKYGAPGMPSCPFHKAGETYVTDFRMPGGFCADAWHSIDKYVFALAHAKGPFYWNDWARKGKAVACCNDAFRPVTFLIEALDEASSPEEGPVRT